MTSALAFAKYEGLGNDFILVDAKSERDLGADRASRLCDRHYGIGADGVLLVLPPRAPDCAARMRVINADGSIPEMCGNGLRCVAVHVARARHLQEGTFYVDTDAGPRACAVEDARGEGMVTVDMGAVRVLGDRGLVVAGGSIALTLADAGNPHAVLLGAFSRADVERLGPQIAAHSDFPGGVNVNFGRVAGDSLELVVWERGVGVTLACGTGACATGAVACAKGLLQTERSIPVRLPGGALSVTIDRAGRAAMRGPARRVFSGTIELWGVSF